MYYSVRDVTVLDGHRIEVAFADGKRGVFGMSAYLGRNLYRPLRSKALFRQAAAMDGTVVWPGDIDVAPERHYTDCVPTERRVL